MPIVNFHCEECASLAILTILTKVRISAVRSTPLFVLAKPNSISITVISHRVVSPIPISVVLVAIVAVLAHVVVVRLTTVVVVQWILHMERIAIGAASTRCDQQSLDSARIKRRIGLTLRHALAMMANVLAGCRYVSIMSSKIRV